MILASGNVRSIKRKNSFLRNVRGAKSGSQTWKEVINVRITDKWVVYDTRSELYFAGMPGGVLRLEQICNIGKRHYKTKNGAQHAIDRIMDNEYVKGKDGTNLVVKHIDIFEIEDIPKVPKKLEPEKPAFAEVTDWSNWEKVLAFAKPLTLADEVAGKKIKFAKIMLCRTIIANQEIFGVIARDGKLYSSGIGGGKNAVNYFLDEIRNYLFERVTMGGKG